MRTQDLILASPKFNTYTIIPFVQVVRVAHQTSRRFVHRRRTMFRCSSNCIFKASIGHRHRPTGCRSSHRIPHPQMHSLDIGRRFCQIHHRNQAHLPDNHCHSSPRLLSYQPRLHTKICRWSAGAGANHFRLRHLFPILSRSRYLLHTAATLLHLLLRL